MKLENKLLIGALALASAIGMGQYGPVHKINGCEIYQGYENGRGERTYVFDEEILSKREGIPNHALSGDSGMSKNLEMGKKYRLEIMKPRLSIFFPNRLLSFENCGQDSE